jgi:hypothetical protein
VAIATAASGVSRLPRSHACWNAAGSSCSFTSTRVFSAPRSTQGILAPSSSRSAAESDASSAASSAHLALDDFEDVALARRGAQWGESITMMSPGSADMGGGRISNEPRRRVAFAAVAFFADIPTSRLGAASSPGQQRSRA